MIKAFNINSVFVKVTVVSMDNEIFENCDIPSEPFGGDFSTVQFWSGDKLIIIPMHQVKKISFYNDKE